MDRDSNRDLAIECLVHDMNNVFQTLLEAADLLALDSRWESVAGIIVRSVERGQNILESVDATRRAPVDLLSVLDKSIQFTEDVLTQSDRTIRFERDIEPGLALVGSAAAWERVFVNLFLNSAQAMPQGGSIRIRAAATPQRIEIDVRDQGPGIPAEILANIFQPGFSTRNSRRGLGLHIVETIVRQHGGTVSAANSPDGGALFEIRVPVSAVKVSHACA
jgi:signal transduction histidine kinase